MAEKAQKRQNVLKRVSFSGKKSDAQPKPERKRSVQLSYDQMSPVEVSHEISKIKALLEES